MKLHNPSSVRTVEAQYRDIYSHAVETNLGLARQLHISGQLGIDPSGKLEATFSAQCRRALQNVEALLEAAGMTKDHIVRVVYYVTRREDLAALNATRAERWSGVRPAVTTVLVAGLVAPEFLVEVEVLAQEEASGSA